MSEESPTTQRLVNGNSAHSSPRLRVTIAGAGIGGLAAAIGLRKQGHLVQVYEQASSVRGVGFGIHLAPNGVGLLRALGVDIEAGGAVPMNAIRYYKHNGELLSREDRKATAGKWQNQWFLASRVRLHESLVRIATSPEGEGTPVSIHTSCKVAKLDPLTGTVELQDRTVIEGDVIVGADGVFSRTRDLITGTRVEPYRSRHNCFRMMLKREDLLTDPSVHAPEDETMDMIYSPTTKTVLYPTLDNTRYNCVVTHLTELTSGQVDNPKEKLLEVCKDYSAPFRNLFNKADPDLLKVWPLFDMETLPTFTKERLAIIGDAAHPFTPHLAQGGVMALEDAVSLSVMLSRGTTAAEVPERLQLFVKARHERGTTTQKISLLVGGDTVEETNTEEEAGEKKESVLNVHKYLDMALSHDEFHASTQILREWQWQQARHLSWRQPTVFGPSPGPQRDISGRPQLNPNATTVTVSIKFETSATLLRNLFPNQNYCFDKPDTVTTASFCIQNHLNLDWLACGSYDSFAFYIHDVQYTSPEGKPSELATYCPIMFENLPDSICSGREELGLPKLFSDIACSSGSHDYQAKISWRGAEWASFKLEDLQVGSPDLLKNDPLASQGILVHKYMPKTGHTAEGSDEAQCRDAEYDVFYPGHEKDAVENGISPALTSCGGRASFEIKDLGFDKLPTLHHIVARLAEIPVFKIVEGNITKQQGEEKWSNGLRL
ncbi:hypothetical protein MMC08_007678 [Hypocenomyce scalaris]|nr:hypothetical protein [Hypocenomyce scalaris]